MLFQISSISERERSVIIFPSAATTFSMDWNLDKNFLLVLARALSGSMFALSFEIVRPAELKSLSDEAEVAG